MERINRERVKNAEEWIVYDTLDEFCEKQVGSGAS
jgi:hypothetical protein